MSPTIILIAASALSFIGLASILFAILYGNRSDGGRKAMNRLSQKWQKKKTDLWDTSIARTLCERVAKVIYIEPTIEAKLANKIARAGLSMSAKEYTARTYVSVGLAAVLFVVCILLKFYIAIIGVVLFGAYLVLSVRAKLNDIIKAKEIKINAEMPRFVRTVCRNLQADRDVISVVKTYRKIAGPELGSELDVLIAEMTSGNIEKALSHFENRVGTPEAYRLCSALKNISTGVDQTSALIYLAEDMSKHAKENIRRELSKRPGKMKRSMIPATMITVVMLLYVLITFMIDNFTKTF